MKPVTTGIRRSGVLFSVAICLSFPCASWAATDTDGDGINDAADNCPQLANTGQENLDQDRLGDACDPFPEVRLVAFAGAARSAPVGGSIPVTFRLVDDSGMLRSDLSGVRATVTVDGAARFSSVATEGILIAGGGTSQALVEFVGGVVTLATEDQIGEQVTPAVADTEGFGIDPVPPFAADLELSDGGFRPELARPFYNSAWEWGAPQIGPGNPHSGLFAWGTGLTASYGPFIDSRLTSPPIILAPGSAPELVYWSWLASESNYDPATVEVTIDNGATWVELTRSSGYETEWIRHTVDLSRYAGNTIRVGFHFSSDRAIEAAGWFVDDISVEAQSLVIHFLAPDGDDDRDGLTNAVEQARGTDPLQADTDGDAVADGTDNCPLDDNPEQFDVSLDGTGDACQDSDSDGWLDSQDNCPLIANAEQLDNDGDGDGEECDNCPQVVNSDQSDTNQDGTGDACQDSDHDNLLDSSDNCPQLANPYQDDFDRDGVGDACDNCFGIANTNQQDSDLDGTGDDCEDRDGDGVPDLFDNCPDDANPYQYDPDNDGLGERCDNCIFAANPDQRDFDLDGTGDACDDADADGVPDSRDNCLRVANASQYDEDHDGVGDECDNCASTPNSDQADLDHDGVGDACVDTDGDRVEDASDNCPAQPNPGQRDGDGDKLGDVCDPYPEIALAVRFSTARSWTLVGQGAMLRFELVDAAGERRADLDGVRCTLHADNGGTFADTATRGSLISGGGTSAVVVEFDAGVVELTLSNDTASNTQIVIVDSDSVGITGVAPKHYDFETTIGDITTEGSMAVWEWGPPTSYPFVAHSGLRVLGTIPSDRLRDPYDVRLVLPDSVLATRSTTFSYWSAFNIPYCCVTASLDVSTDDGATWQPVGYPRVGTFAFTRIDQPLNSFAGQRLRLSLRLVFTNSVPPVWYIDDLTVPDYIPTVRFVTSDADPDSDGVPNSREADFGTNPFATDSDFDQVMDGVDNCPTVPNRGQADRLNPDGVGDACEDSDQDLHIDDADNCPLRYNPGQADSDADQAGDACDVCPDHWNPRQIDLDGDGTGEACSTSAGRPGPAIEPFRLPFVAPEVEFDSGRNRIYVADPGGAVHVMDATTGLIERSFDFDARPETLAISQDRTRLFIGLASSSADPDPRVSEHTSIASIDLVHGVKDREFFYDSRARDIAAVSTDRIAIIAVRPEATTLDTVDTTKGLVVHREPIRAGNTLISHPNRKRLYAGIDFTLKRLDTANGIVHTGYEIRDNEARSYTPPLWCCTAADEMFNQVGVVISSADDPTSDMRFLSRLEGPRSIFDDAAIDNERGVLATVGAIADTNQPYVRYFNLHSRLEFGSIALPSRANFVGIIGAHVFVVHVRAGATTLERFPHPAPNGANNAPPSVVVRVSPGVGGTTKDLFAFDASATTDPEDELSQLRFRWDFDGDGSWDTRFSGDPRATHRFELAGRHRVDLQVVDTYGLSARTTSSFDVVFAPDYGSVPASSGAFVLPFRAADSEFDLVHDRLLLADSLHHRVVALDLVTGEMIREFSFEGVPTVLSTTPAGDRLFVGIKREDGLDNPVPFYRATWEIASFDLEGLVKDRHFQVGVPIFDLAALSPERLALSQPGFSAGPSAIDARNGEVVLSEERGTYHYQERLVAHLSGSRVYATAGYPFHELSRYDLAPDGFRLTRTPFQGVRPPAGNGIWCFRGAKFAVTESGYVVATDSDPELDIRRIDDLRIRTPEATIDDAAEEAGTDLLAILQTAWPDGTALVKFFNSRSLALISETRLPRRGLRVAAKGDRVFVLIENPVGMRLRVLASPTAGIAADSPPVAQLSVSPTSGITTQLIARFDATGSSDPEDGTNGLRYRWDFTGDGTWDTQFSTDPTSSYQYEFAGQYNARLEVVDSLGKAAIEAQTIDVAYAPDPGHVVTQTEETAWSLRFRARAFVEDPARRRMFAADEYGHRILTIDLGTGLPEREFKLRGRPRSLALSADGTRLFFSAGPPDVTEIDFEMPRYGFVGSIDLASNTKDRYIMVPFDPDDIVPLAANRVALAVSGSRDSEVAIVELTSGQVLDRKQLRLSKRLIAHPSGSRFYVAGAIVLYRVDVTPDGRMVESADSTAQSSSLWIGDNGWASPDGTRLLTGGGELLALTADPSTDMAPITSIGGSQITAAVWDAAAGEIYVGVFSGISRCRSSDLTTIEQLSERQFVNFLGKTRKELFAAQLNYGGSLIERFTINHPPVADAGPDQRVECASSTSTPVTLDGSASRDVDSAPNFHDDIRSWFWQAGDRSLGADPIVDAEFPLGAHEATLTVTDDTGESAVDTTSILIVDSTAPTGGVTAPPTHACFGPAALPVVVRNDFADRCDATVALSYDPPAGPSYSTHGDLNVTVTATDDSANAATAMTSFTIDLKAPQVQFQPPVGGWSLSSLPFNIVFTSSDDDGAAGGPVREVMYLDDCLLYDGNSVGNHDGLLSDEQLVIDRAALCQAAARCGIRSWNSPVLAIQVTDCGGNTGTDKTEIHGSYRLPAGACGGAALPSRSPSRGPMESN